MDFLPSLAEIADFVRAIMKQEFALMMGVGGLVASISGAIFYRSKPGKVLLGCGLVALFLTPSYAWRAEHRLVAEQGLKIADLQTQLNDLTKPIFTTSKINFVGLATDDRYPGWQAVHIIATLINSGAPSIARAYTLEVVSPAGKRVVLERLNPVAGITALTLPDGSAIYLCPAETLDVRTAGTPIDRGGSRNGHISFIGECEFCTPEQLRRDTVILTFEDAEATKHQVSVSGQTEYRFSGPPHFPTMHLSGTCPNL